jgi:poly(ADP-ribose) glycohydrolase ARH3
MSRPAPTPDRFRGCLLGLAVADALGAPFEGCPADVVYRDFGPVRNIFNHPPVDTLTYTDDTQMTIAVAEQLVADGRIEVEALAQRFGDNFQPERGYGPGARRILEAIRHGEDWREMSRTLMPGGSLGNGAAMRVAPVGLMFHHDIDRLLDEAALSALPTHTHPIGMDGARMMALAVACVLREPAGTPFDHDAFYALLLDHVATEEFAHALDKASKMSADDVVGVLGHSLEAHRSVPTAIACFASHPDSYEKAVCRAIAQGGDTDTLAAMAAAISGARLGLSAVPQHLLSLLEDNNKGRSHIDRLAHDLCRRFQSTNPI